MVEVVVIAILAALAVVAAVLLILFFKGRNTTPTAQSHDIKQFKTVGLGSSPMENNSQAHSVAKGEVMVASEHHTSAKPADNQSSRFMFLGGAAAVVFGALAARLWSIQIMENSQYVSRAEDNLYTTVTTPAARGMVYDTNGIMLVTNRITQTVLADSTVANDRDVLRRLSVVLGVPLNVVRKRINDVSAGAQSQRVVASDVRMRDIAFIAEHADAFPNVSVESRTVRAYPYGALAAHVLGYTGSPDEEQLTMQTAGRTIESTDTIGRSGIESTYDNLLSGDHGQRRVMVDASGNVLNVVSEIQSSQGCDIALTIDARVQYVADKALADTIAPDGTIGTNKGVAGSIVVLNVQDGSVVAMSSFPTFDPTYFTGTIPEDIWNLYASDEAYAPLNNRAINGQYAAASTFKAFTSIAGLEYGFATKDTSWACGGSWDGFGSGDVQMCWNHDGHGTLDLRGGIVNSCDVVFYEIAKSFYTHGPHGTGEVSETALQESLAKFNFGKPTGVDLEGESSGRIPTPEWKAEYWRNVPSEAVWRGGDYTNMIIGQGDVLVTPLQLAVAYGAVATGNIIKPHLLKEVYNAEGEPVITIEPEVVQELDVKQEYLDYVRDALHGMAQENSQPSAAFSAINVDAAAKSGTAENGDLNDNAWFVAYAPYNKPKYVVTCVVEQGGGGSDTALPIVAKVMDAVMQAESGTLNINPEPLRGSSGHSVALSYSSGSARTD